jgi:hypothetical protein
LTAKSGRGTVYGTSFNFFLFPSFFGYSFSIRDEGSRFVDHIYWGFMDSEIFQPQWMAPEVLRSEPSNEK